MKASEFDTARRFFIDTVQLCPLERPNKWENMVTFSSPAAKNFSFPVVGGQTMELAIAQFWSSGIGSHETTTVEFEIVFHGINIHKNEVVLDGSEGPVRIDVEATLASEKLTPSAILNKVRVPYLPIESKLLTLATDRDKLPSGKQILALKLTYKFNLEDGAEVKPHIPLLNNRIYDTKFESQFYMMYDMNKRVYAMGDVYPKSTKLSKGEYNLQLYLRHENVQYLEKMKQLVLFIIRSLKEKDVLQLDFFSQPDGVFMENNSFKSSVLVPQKKEAFYVGSPSKDMLPKGLPEGSVLFGAISYGKLSYFGQGARRNPEKNPASNQISYIVPPRKLNQKGKGSSTGTTKALSKHLEEEVRDAKIKVLANLKQGTDDECSEWKKLSASLKSEYPNYTPLLAKILEGLVSQENVEDKIHYYEGIVDAADEVIESIDKDELAWLICIDVQKMGRINSDPEDEEAENIKKKMETTRDQLAEGLYQKGLALAEIDCLKGNKLPLIADEASKDVDETADHSLQPDLFEDNFNELKKWVDIKSAKYGTLLVIRERRHGRFGIAIKALHDMIQDSEGAPKKQFYELKLSLLEQIGWFHLVMYERQWMHVRFPANLPLF